MIFGLHQLVATLVSNFILLFLMIFPTLLGHSPCGISLMYYLRSLHYMHSFSHNSSALSLACKQITARNSTTMPLAPFCVPRHCAQTYLPLHLPAKRSCRTSPTHIERQHAHNDASCRRSILLLARRSSHYHILAELTSLPRSQSADTA